MDQNIQLGQDQTPVTPSDASVVSTPADQTPEEIKVEETFQEPETHVQRDSAFNCPDCYGEGLKDEYTICSTCRGTGKI